MGAFFRWIFAAIGQILFEGWGSANAQALVRTLAVAVERNVPVVPVLEALADEAGGSWRMRVQKLADMLASGIPIPEALDSVAGLLPEEALATIRIGFDAGRPAEALREVADTIGRQSESRSLISSGTLMYLSSVTLVGVLILTFIVIWIIPKFKAIFEGFDLTLPPVTQWLLYDLPMGLADYWYWLAIPVLGVGVVLLGAGGFLSELLGQGVYWRPSTWLAMLVPRIHTPLLLRCMGLAVEGGVPFPGTLTSIAAHTRDRYLQSQLGLAASRVGAGEDTWQVLIQSRFITAREGALFDASVKNGNLGWALRQTAVALERQAATRMRFILDCVHPLLLLAMGTVVGTIAVALFLPLVELIQKMT